MEPNRLLVAVFGSADPLAGDPLYELARRAGELLATAGYGVLTGGYGGVMEGASRGAAERGGVAVGVTCAGFLDRTPNRHLTEIREEPDLVTRTGSLIDAACGYVVLHGKSGTLAELTLVWALHRAGSLAWYFWGPRGGRAGRIRRGAGEVSRRGGRRWGVGSDSRTIESRRSRSRPRES